MCKDEAKDKYAKYKYEVKYWDYRNEKEVSVEYTSSLLRALWLLHKLEKEWHCVTIKFRRNKVKWWVGDGYNN